MALLNYTTKKEASETIGEIQKILSQYDVSGIMTEYEGRQVSSVAFKMIVGGRIMAFRLPCNWRAVQAVLTEQNANRGYRRGQYGGKYKQKRIDDSDEHAIRVAWRIIKDWVEAQMALIQVHMAPLEQVFLPFAQDHQGTTLYEQLRENRFQGLALPAPGTTQAPAQS